MFVAVLVAAALASINIAASSPSVLVGRDAYTDLASLPWLSCSWMREKTHHFVKLAMIDVADTLTEHQFAQHDVLAPTRGLRVLTTMGDPLGAIAGSQVSTYQLSVVLANTSTAAELVCLEYRMLMGLFDVAFIPHIDVEHSAVFYERHFGFPVVTEQSFAPFASSKSFIQWMHKQGKSQHTPALYTLTTDVAFPAVVTVGHTSMLVQGSLELQQAIANSVDFIIHEAFEAVVFAHLIARHGVLLGVFCASDAGGLVDCSAVSSTPSIVNLLSEVMSGTDFTGFGTATIYFSPSALSAAQLVHVLSVATISEDRAIVVPNDQDRGDGNDAILKIAGINPKADNEIYTKWPRLKAHLATLLVERAVGLG